MDKYSFIASIVDTLVWPVVIMVLLLVLKKPLSQLLLGLSKFKYNNIEMDFGKKLSKLEDTLEKKDKDQKNQYEFKLMNEMQDEIKTVAKISPSAAVTIAWDMVEQEIISVINRAEISPEYPPYNSTIRNIMLLKVNGLVDESTYLLLNELKTLRNKSVYEHNEDKISYFAAIKYYEIAIRVISRLKNN